MANTVSDDLVFFGCLSSNSVAHATTLTYPNNEASREELCPACENASSKMIRVKFNSAEPLPGGPRLFKEKTDLRRADYTSFLGFPTPVKVKSAHAPQTFGCWAAPSVFFL